MCFAPNQTKSKSSYTEAYVAFKTISVDRPQTNAEVASRANSDKQENTTTSDRNQAVTKSVSILNIRPSFHRDTLQSQVLAAPILQQIYDVNKDSNQFFKPANLSNKPLIRGAIQLRDRE
jgi:hypothetical protein